VNGYSGNTDPEAYPVAINFSPRVFTKSYRFSVSRLLEKMAISCVVEAVDSRFELLDNSNHLIVLEISPDSSDAPLGGKRLRMAQGKRRRRGEHN
jgi:hypothetical protein